MSTAYIVDTVRTPRSRRKGKYSGVHPVDLLTYPLNALLERNTLSGKDIEDVIVGCVTQVNEQSWCVGRAAVLAAGWPIEVPACTVNRLCGSSLQAMNSIAAGIQSGNYDLAVAAGLEHMTRVPMFSDITSGEESPKLKEQHPDLVQQGPACERLARKFSISRAESDAFALESQRRALAALQAGHFSKSYVAVPYRDAEGKMTALTADDTPRAETTAEVLAGLKCAFEENGALTAGNASAIVDGAASILLASDQALKKHSLKARAKIRAFAAVGSDPGLMLSGPVPASQLALKKAGLSVKDIDLWEINEAFAPVPIFSMRELGLDASKVNVNGGAIALGHPLGATGAILVGTLLDELERQNKQLGAVTMCIGLGMAITTIIERL
jgi:acetyl-CoA acyltransferase